MTDIEVRERYTDQDVFRLSPYRRLTTQMRPSHPVRHFWPLRNQRFFRSRLRSAHLVERLGMQTRFPPLAFAAASFLAE